MGPENQAHLAQFRLHPTIRGRVTFADVLRVDGSSVTSVHGVAAQVTPLDAKTFCDRRHRLRSTSGSFSLRAPGSRTSSFLLARSRGRHSRVAACWTKVQLFPDHRADYDKIPECVAV